MLNFLTKITSSNRFSSTALAVAVLFAGCYLMLNANNNNLILYTGLGLVVITGIMTIDAYYKASNSEHYESIIEKLNTMLKDSRSENRQSRDLAFNHLKTNGQAREDKKEYKELVGE